MKRWMTVLITTFLLITHGLLWSQDAFPTRPITVLVGFAPGGVGDILARAICAGATKELGQPLVVVNKPGAGGTIAADNLIQQKPDGYTLMGVGMANLALGIHTESVSWKPSDFTLILGACQYNKSLVTLADAPYSNFEQWMEHVKKNPGYKYGTYGALTEVHLMMEWIAKKLGLNIVPVHFKGDSPGVAAIMGGHVSAYLGAGGHVPQIKGGKLKTILQMAGEPQDADPGKVSTLRKAVPEAPAELVDFPYGIVAPKGLPPQVRKKLHDAFKKAIDSPEFIQTTDTASLPRKYHDPETLAASLSRATDMYGKILKDLGLERK